MHTLTGSFHWFEVCRQLQRKFFDSSRYCIVLMASSTAFMTNATWSATSPPKVPAQGHALMKRLTRYPSWVHRNPGQPWRHQGPERARLPHLRQFHRCPLALHSSLGALEEPTEAARQHSAVASARRNGQGGGNIFEFILRGVPDQLDSFLGYVY